MWSQHKKPHGIAYESKGLFCQTNKLRGEDTRTSAAPVVQKGSPKKMSPSTIKAMMLWTGLCTCRLVQQENRDLQCQNGGNDLLVDEVSNQLQGADHHHLVVSQKRLPKLHASTTHSAIPQEQLARKPG
jgi:hypothetical protein